MVDIQNFKRRAITSLVVDYRTMDGPLIENEIVTTMTFLSRNRHSNTTSDDLSEIFQISVE